MKKKFIVVLLLSVILLVGGGIATWKLISNEKKISSSNQQKENFPPLNELSDQGLEKCLLADFSRRLELKKYFVFSLRELTKEPLKTSHETLINGRIVKPSLSKDLTEIAKPYTTEWKKEGVAFVNENYGTQNIDDLVGKELDKKIDNEKDYYIIFEKNAETKKTYFYKGMHTNFIFIRVKPVKKHVFESKEKALEVLKTDPALKKKT